MDKHPLSKYIVRSGKSLAKIASDAKVSRMTLYRLLRGEQNATIDLLTRVSAATDGEVPVSAFIPVSGPKKPNPTPEKEGAA